MKKLIALFMAIAIALSSIIVLAENEGTLTGVSNCAKEGKMVNRNPLLGETDKQCCEGLIEDRVSKSYSICKTTIGASDCATEGKMVNRNPLLGETGKQCCEGLIEDRVSKSYSICKTTKATNFGQEVSACMQELLKRQPNLLKSEAAKKCVFEKKAAGEFMIAQKLRVQERLEECKEDAVCKEKLQARLGKMDGLTEAAKERLSKIEERRLEKIKEIKVLEAKSKIKIAKAFRAREIAQLKLTEARAKYTKAKVNFAEAQEKLKITKGKFDAAVKLKKACSTDAESEECKKAQEEIFTASKEHLLGIIETLVNHLNKVKSHIESNDKLSEEESADSITKIDSQLTSLDKIKKEIEATQTKEELKAATVKLKEAWQGIKVVEGSFAGRSVNARIGGIILKSKYLEIKLEKILSRMEENGIDTSAIEPKVQEFHTYIEAAKLKHEEALAKYKEAETAKSKEALEEAKKLMSESKEQLKLADIKLKEIFALLKSQAKEILADETIDTEIEEETESTDNAEAPAA